MESVTQRRVAVERDAVLEVYKRNVDRSLIRENLRLSPQQRVEKLMKLQELAAELRRAGRKAAATK